MNENENISEQPLKIKWIKIQNELKEKLILKDEFDWKIDSPLSDLKNSLKIV